MNEFEALEQFVQEWKEVKRMKRLNQELYDLLGGAIIYTIENSKKYNMPIPNIEAIYRMADRIHAIMDEINSASETSILRTKRKFTGEDPTSVGQNLWGGSVKTVGHREGC